MISTPNLSSWTSRAIGPRVDILRVKPMTFRVYVDGKPLSRLYTHPKTAETVALAIIEALREAKNG